MPNVNLNMQKLRQAGLHYVGGRCRTAAFKNQLFQINNQKTMFPVCI